MEEKNLAPTTPIDPLEYLGRDLRELTEEEVERIITEYPTLRNTDDGYILGQEIIALVEVRGGIKEVPSLQKMLDDKNTWIFKGSKATQVKNKLVEK